VGNLEMLQALVFEPRKFFAALDQRPKYWFPLLVLIVALVAQNVWYVSVVDLGWVTDQQLRHSALARSLTEDQITQAVQRAQSMRVVSAISQAIVIPIVITVIVMISALYDLLAGKIVSFERSFRQWFAFTAWLALPAALLVIPAALVLATADSAQIPQDALQPLSLNALLLHRKAGEAGYSLFNALNPIQLVVLYLAIFGVKQWSGRSWLFSAVFIGIPWVLIFGPWAWFSLG